MRNFQIPLAITFLNPKIFSRPHLNENSRQYCFSGQIFYREQSLGAPDLRAKPSTILE